MVTKHKVQTNQQMQTGDICPLQLGLIKLELLSTLTKQYEQTLK